MAHRRTHTSAKTQSLGLGLGWALWTHNTSSVKSNQAKAHLLLQSDVENFNEHGESCLACMLYIYTCHLRWNLQFPVATWRFYIYCPQIVAQTTLFGW